VGGRLTKIADLKVGTKNISIRAKISELPKPLQVMTRFGSTAYVTNATMDDSSGKVRLVLWGDQSKTLKVGDMVDIEGGYLKEYKGERQFGVSRKGKIKKVRAVAAAKEKAKPKPKVKKKVVKKATKKKPAKKKK
jgi:ssDNA-binding replication factor A large subunit